MFLKSTFFLINITADSNYIYYGIYLSSHSLNFLLFVAHNLLFSRLSTLLKLNEVNKTNDTIFTYNLYVQIVLLTVN